MTHSPSGNEPEANGSVGKHFSLGNDAGPQAPTPPPAQAPTPPPQYAPTPAPQGISHYPSATQGFSNGPVPAPTQPPPMPQMQQGPQGYQAQQDYSNASPQQYQLNQQHQQNWQVPQVQRQTSNSNGKVMLISLLVVLLLGGGGTAWYLLSDGNNGDDGNGSSNELANKGNEESGTVEEIDKTDGGEESAAGDDAAEKDSTTADETAEVPAEGERALVAVDWYQAAGEEWSYDMTIDGTNRTGYLVADGYFDHEDCNGYMTGDFDDAFLNDNGCLYSIEGSYTHDEFDMYACERAFEFGDTESATAVAEELNTSKDNWEGRSQDFRIGSCTGRDIEGAVGYFTRINQNEKWIILTTTAVFGELSEEQLEVAIFGPSYMGVEHINVTRFWEW